MNILCIHGVGHAEARADWGNDWCDSILKGIGEWRPALATNVQFEQFAYDQQFADAPLNTFVYLQALASLSTSWVGQALGRDLEQGPSLRWTAGMVAQWSTNPALRANLRRVLVATINRFKPDLIVAHSLGSLICYDTLSHSDSRDQITGFSGSLLTFGSQIAHPALSKVYGGRIAAPTHARQWWNLFNENDHILTCSISIPNAANFSQVLTPFTFEWINHDADHYLTHTNARQVVWQAIALQPAARAIAARGIVVKPPRLAPATARPKQRALLVGIAEYANPDYQLQGPVNDVFLVSQTLQEMGVDADAIRVVLNDRATAAGIRERLQWLLAEARAGETLFFYFSGHGAQVPAYGHDAEVDHIDECLVPYDFDWQHGNAIFDDEFAALYSQLPYDCTFVAMLDCCHAGGMQRGVGPSASSTSQGTRTLNLPDDIRHRALRWDRDLGLWLPREKLMAEGKKRLAALRKTQKSKASERIGSDGTLRRMGRAQAQRGDDPTAFYAARKAYGHHGPYMPVLLEACAENQSAYEYQHGSVHYGAFTYGLCQALKFGQAPQAAKHRKKLAANAAPQTFERLMLEATKRVAAVAPGPQTPQLVCPTFRKQQSIL